MPRSFAKCVVTLFLGLSLALVVVEAQVAAETPLYPFKGKVSKNTKTAVSREVRVGKRLYEVYSRPGSPNAELFRVEIGDFATGKLVKTWNYGIATEIDLNGDGEPDYLWYGGDDTSEIYLLFCSAGGKYDRVDVIKSARETWRNRFHKTAPDFADLGGKFHISEISWSEPDRSLLVTVLSEAPNKRTQLVVPEADFSR